MKYLFILSLFISPLSAFCDEFIPDQGFVPDKETAVKIAEAVLVPVYGTQVLKQRPFNATLNNHKWIVEGTFPCPKPKVCLGGVAHLVIDKRTGQILNMIHGK